MMINGYQTEILKIFENIRNTENKALKERRLEISKKFPNILEIDNTIQKLSLKMALSLIKSSDSEKIVSQFKDKITDLRIKKCELLVEHGYPIDYLNLHYECEKCKDTGFIGNIKCECYNQKLINLYYKDSDLESIVKENNFDNFDLSLFSAQKTETEKYSERKNMQNNLDYILKEYLPNFNEKSTNLLFYGNPGSGKTYLSYCIAKTALDLGNLVIYKTSEDVIKTLRDVRFNNIDSNFEKLLLECDLLIIDDLGAEHLNEFSIAELFGIINKRILTNKKMLVSTNLTLSNITKQYSERIASRLLGDFKIFKFYSEDIRIRKNFARNKSREKK